MQEIRRTSSMKLLEPIDMDFTATTTKPQLKQYKNATPAKSNTNADSSCCKCSNVCIILMALILFVALVAIAVYIGVTYASTGFCYYQNRTKFIEMFFLSGKGLRFRVYCQFKL